MRERRGRWTTAAIMGLSLTAGLGWVGVAWAADERFLPPDECATLKATHTRLADGPAGQHFVAGPSAAAALKPEERDQVRELIRLAELLAFRCEPEKPRPLKPIPQKNPDKQAAAGALTTGSIAGDPPAEPAIGAKPKTNPAAKPVGKPAAAVVQPAADEDTVFAPPPDWARTNE